MWSSINFSNFILQQPQLTNGDITARNFLRLQKYLWSLVKMSLSCRTYLSIYLCSLVAKIFWADCVDVSKDDEKHCKDYLETSTSLPLLSPVQIMIFLCTFDNGDTFIIIVQSEPSIVIHWPMREEGQVSWQESIISRHSQWHDTRHIHKLITLLITTTGSGMIQWIKYSRCLDTYLSTKPFWC